MKKIANKLLLVALLSTSLLNAEIVFDLHTQHFANAIKGGMKVGRYDLDYTQVSTNLNYVKGSYVTDNDSGFFNVSLKSPIKDWSVSFGISVFFPYYVSYETRTIKLIAENGETVMLSIGRKQLYFEGKNLISMFSDGDHIFDISFTKKDDKIVLNVNGKYSHTISRATFSALKSVEIRIVNDEDEYGDNKDRLDNLTIGSK